jgi:hypothetical protein
MYDTRKNDTIQNAAVAATSEAKTSRLFNKIDVLPSGQIAAARGDNEFRDRNDSLGATEKNAVSFIQET